MPTQKKDKTFGDYTQLDRLIKKRLRFTEAVIAEKAGTATESKEHLRVSKEHGYYRYFLVSQKGDQHGKYIPRENLKEAAAIAQRDYDKKVLAAAEKEQRLLSAYQAFAAENNVNKMYDDLIDGRKTLVKPVYPTDEDCIAAWNRIPCRAKSTENVGAGFLTKKGETVRSKTEVLIADALCDAGIPYLYEQQLLLRNGAVYPDFTILDLKNRRTLYWEHFGLMDDKDYVRSMLRKMRSYQAEGIFPGRDLIMTFESSAFPIGTKEIREVIGAFLND